MHNRRTLLKMAPLVLGVGLLSILAPRPSAHGVMYGTGTYGTCTYNACSITLTTAGPVSLGLTASGGGDVYSIDKDILTVNTAASTGYTLQLESDTAETALVGASDSIAAVAGTYSSPLVLGTNTWGYRLDGLGGFGAGPTSTVSNSSASSLTFAGLSPSGSPTIIRSTTSAATDEVTEIWYGARIAATLQADNYSRTLLYTAITN